jgi:hypothetical protein
LVDPLELAKLADRTHYHPVIPRGPQSFGNVLRMSASGADMTVLPEDVGF